MFYVASENGTYSNFDGIVLLDEIAILYRADATWIKWAGNIDYLEYGAGGIRYTACPEQYNYLGKGLGHMYGLCANGNTDVLVSFYNTGSYTAVEQTRTAPITFTDIRNFYIFGTDGAARTQAESGVTERTAHRIYMVGEPFAADEMTLFSGACEDLVAVFAEP